jgi:glutathione synthase/RimK-type ligase-like ATP-grasp enzyme
MRIAFVTTDRLLPYQRSATEPCFTHDDQLLADELTRRGHLVQPLVWHTATTHAVQMFNCLLMRSPWDYMTHRTDFARFLDLLVASGVRCVNPVPMMRENLDKTYLLHLHAAGHPVPPTVLVPQGTAHSLRTLLAERHWPEVVVKPTVSGAAFNTFRIKVEDTASFQPQWQQLVHSQAMLVQPFMPAVLTEGEWSLVFFGGAYSHAVLKRARPGDFRVQDDHGGTVELATPPPSVVTLGQRVLAAQMPVPTYARLDGILCPDLGFLIMELELVEPELFFRADADSPARLAQVLGL